MNIQETIGSIVADKYRTADVFSKMKIDFCCKGGRTIDEVCRQQKIDPDKLMAALEEAQQLPAQLEDDNIQEWSATVLAEYIEKNHHSYVREATPTLAAYLKKIAAVHGDRHT
jgi:regulator of cell morphogenesis and NO signaling